MTTAPRPRDFDRLRNRLFEDLDRWPDLVREAMRPTQPVTTVEETTEAWLVSVDVPGVRPGDLSVEVDAGRLVVEGRRRRTERAGPDPGPSGLSRLDLTLPADVDQDAVRAELDGGVLVVRLPRAPSSGRRRIPVAGARAASPMEPRRRNG